MTMRDSFCRALPILLLDMAMTGMGQSAVPQGPAPGKMINVYGHKLHIIVPGRKTGNLWLSSRLAVERSPKIGKPSRALKGSAIHNLSIIIVKFFFVREECFGGPWRRCCSLKCFSKILIA
jgi:hypothetical protein